MPTVRNVLTDPAGNPRANVNVSIRLVAGLPESELSAGWVADDSESVLATITLTTDATGLWSTNLVANDLIAPAGSYYLVYEQVVTPTGQEQVAYRISVPDGAGPFWVGDRLTSVPDEIPAAALLLHQDDPDSAHAASAVRFASGTFGGVAIASDDVQTAIEEATTALAARDDLEATTRGTADAAIAAALVTHEDATTAVHGIVDTAALVYDDDPALGDARVPLAHAASHADGGSDEFAVDASQVTSGVLDDARIPATITRDTELSAALAAIVDAAPGTLDTLNELAVALGDDPNFATTITTALAGKQPLDADLTAIAALATTAFGRALLALADPAALRTAAGFPLADVQVFTSSGTWTKPTWATAETVVTVVAIGGGGGGGSGRRGAALSVRCGGGGGAHGGRSTVTARAADLGNTEPVVVGFGGAGGAAVTANDTNGNVGTTGGTSTFGGNATVALRATGGGGGAGGSSTSGAGGSSALGNMASAAGGAASTTGGAGAAGGVASAGSGGAGGGLTLTDATSIGGNGGTGVHLLSGAGGSGATGGVSGGNGGSVATNVPGGGAGGGGGSSSNTSAGGNGGDGGLYGGGGGGGSASLNGFNSGKGGDGRSGIVVVITG